MNLAMKTMPWMVASFLAATSLFGQTTSQNQGGCPPQPVVCKPVPQPRCGALQAPLRPTVCAYNAPAEINIGMQGDIDFFVTGSFIYWQPSQDNMAIGLTDNIAIATVAPMASIQGSFIEMDFDFKPGFQVGLGMNLMWDDWVGYAEYTRVHGHHNQSSNGPLGTASILPTWGHPSLFASTTGGQLFNTVSGDYRNNLDFVDVEMSRVYYVGKWLVFHSAWGARGAWMTQNMHVRYVNNQAAVVSGIGVTSAPGRINVYQRAHSWGVGPRMGLIMDWMVGCGFRFFGSGYGDILYTQYKIQDKSVLLPLVSNTNTLVGVPVSVITYDKIRSLLRAHLDCELGLGWGSYFDHNNWHFDLSAAYGFQVFFDQNMFRHFESASMIGINTVPHGNMYVQGLTTTVRLDF